MTGGSLFRSRALRRTLLFLALFFALPLLFELWPFPPLDLMLLFFWSLAAALVLAGLAVAGLAGALGAAISRVRRRPVGRASRLALALSIGGLLLLTPWAAIRWATPGLPRGSHQLGFDPVVWRDPASSRGFFAPRQRMVGALVDRLDRNMSKQEVESLLGPPAETNLWWETGCGLVYRLGPQRDSLFVVDDEWLLLWFDDSGRYRRFEIASD